MPLRCCRECDSETTINVSYSFQNKTTDTLAVDADNNPFRDENWNLFLDQEVMALCLNLNNLDADIVFIKNIDNVIQNKIEKRLVIKKQRNLDRITVPNFKYLHAIEAEEVREESIDEIVLFFRKN
jgi:hypothetical protein